jgi:dolichol kinase
MLSQQQNNWRRSSSLASLQSFGDNRKKDMMKWPSDLQLSPLHNNIAVSMAMVLYFKFAIELSCWMRIRWKRGISRHVLHMLFSTLVIFWPYFDQSEWSWRLNVLVPAVMWSRLVYKGAILRDPNDPDVQNMSLSSSPNDLLFGPLLFAGMMVWLGLYQFMTAEAAIMAAVSLGDGLAPLIGTRYGRHLFQMPLSNPKTMEGSVVGVFLGTVAGCYLYLYMMGIPLLPLRMILAYAGIAAIAEGTSVGNLDNLITPLVLHFSIDYLPTLLPE